MEAVVHLDTHVVVWLYAGELERFPRPAAELLESARLLASPAVVLELQYLFEIGRVTDSAQAVVADLQGRLGLAIDDAPFPHVAWTATDLAWTRDPFDRLIVAQAKAQDCQLLTADKTIHKHYRKALWSRARR